jgi:hypothetical protein
MNMITHVPAGTAFADAQSDAGRAYPVLVACGSIQMLFAPGAPLFWRIGLTGPDTAAEPGAVLCIQEDFWQEYDPIWHRYRDPIVYACHPQAWLDGGTCQARLLYMDSCRRWYFV